MSRELRKQSNAIGKWIEDAKISRHAGGQGVLCVILKEGRRARTPSDFAEVIWFVIQR